MVIIVALLAQHGYGKGEKIHHGLENGDIGGIIFSPKAEDLKKIEMYIKKVKKIHGAVKIFFDPQYYLCALQGDISLGKLTSYAYCNMDISRSMLSDYRFLNKVCESIFDSQHSLDISGYLSPSVIFHDFEDKESQITLSLAKLFGEKVEYINSQLYVSLCINETAFNDIDKMNSFLDTISLFDVRGFYIIIDRNNQNGKINEINPKTLANIMQFVYNLSIINEYNVIIGYSDLLSIPLAAVSNADFASGWFNNSKRFSAGNYVKSTGGHRPKKRYTSSALMNSILLIPEFQTLSDLKLIDNVLTDSPYNQILLPKLDDAKWSDEVSCLHNWHALNQLLEKIQYEKNIVDRLLYLESIINNAMDVYEIILKQTSLDYSSKGAHLPMWKEAIKIFKESIGNL